MMAPIMTSYLLMSVVLIPTFASSCTDDCREKFLVERLKTYDNRISPNFNNDRQITVNTSIYVLSIDSISEIAMDYWVSMYLRQAWQDERLAFAGVLNDTEITLDAKVVDRLWVPDLFFSNEKSGYFHTVTIPNRLVRLSRDGAIFYSSRLTLKVSCPMALQNFPLDTQICDLNIESYGFTKDKLSIEWASNMPAVEVDPGLTMPEYRLTKTVHEYCDKKYSTGVFPCMRLRFYLKRDLGFYMIQTYVPSFLVVVLSWVSFWISPDSVPARISLGVLCVLTMTTQSAGIRQTLPRVSYIKAIDIWMSVCLLFVFLALLEFAIVNVFSRRQVKKAVVEDEKLEEVLETDENGKEAISSISPSAHHHLPGVTVLNPKSKPKLKKKVKNKYIADPKGKGKARFVDAVSRKVFPLVFMVFNIAYWIIYIISSQVPHDHDNDIQSS